MSTLSLSQVLHTKTAFTAGMIRMLEFFKLPQQSRPLKTRTDKSSTAQLLHMIETGHTVFKIGSHEASTLYFLSQKVGDTGRVIAFERQPGVQTYLCEIKHLLRWNNVKIDSTFIRKERTERTSHTAKEKASGGATVIPFNAKVKKYPETVTLDHYCALHALIPDILKIDADGEELPLLLGCEQTLTTHKPKIIVSCDERKAGREKVLSLFRYLLSLGYKGTFMLDSMLLPLENFDFNVYQNPYADFYCSTFMFT